jgi:hypothetical protein
METRFVETAAERAYELPARRRIGPLQVRVIVE